MLVPLGIDALGVPTSPVRAPPIAEPPVIDSIASFLMSSIIASLLT